MRNRFVTFFVLLFLLLAYVYTASACILTSRQTAIAEYSHSRTIIIDNTGNEEVRDYQIRVKLDQTNFHFNETMDKGEDIRFMDEDGITPLNYWIEKWDSSGQLAVIWVKVPFIQSSARKTIYLYYGKPDEISASDGETTFVFFDDFTGALTKWFSRNGASIEENRLKMTEDAYIRSKITLPSGNYSILCRTWGEGKFNLGYVDANTGNGYGFSVETGGMFNGWMISDFYFDQLVGGADGPAGNGTIYILENGRLGYFNYGAAMDSNHTRRAWVKSHWVSINNFVVQLLTLEGTYYADFVAVRKYIDSEPRVIVVSEHDLTLSVNAPNSVHPGSLMNLRSIVRNEGLFADVHVEVDFFVNGRLEDSTDISQLNSGESVALSFAWHSPNIESYYNLTVQIVPVPQEINTGNNRVSKIVKVVKLSLSLSPESGFASVTLVGSGFANQANITITWDGKPIPTIPSSVMTDTYGGFTSLISVPTQNAPGPHIVKASDEEGNAVEETFVVLEMRVPLEYVLLMTALALIAIFLATYSLILNIRRKTKARAN